LRPRGVGVDTDAFNAAMERQREMARAAWAGSGDLKTADYWFPLREKYGATEFLGYDTEASEAVIQTIIKGGPEISELRTGEAGEVIFNQTPFYPESGGQVWDTGWLRRVSDGEFIARVMATHKEAGDLIVHNVRVENDRIRVGDALRLQVDHDRRADVRRNHSATHLLHEALRQVLGDHVAQKGSLVAPDRLRFDFSHPMPVTPDQIERIEYLANERVLENSSVQTRIMGIEDARESGARALFGEKYGDEVRVVIIGEATGNELGWSVELCGGTHVQRTGEIGVISIAGESAVASGVRRIEAFTGQAARRHLNQLAQFAKATSLELRVPIEEMQQRTIALMDEKRRIERDLADVKRRAILAESHTQLDPATVTATAVAPPLIARVIHDVKPGELRSLVDEYKKKLGSGVVTLVAISDGKASLAVGVAGTYASSNSAISIAQTGSTVLGGKAGGRPDFAQGGGPSVENAEDALKAMQAAIRPPSGG
jgi:alanyl-tRNA synthetase